MTCLGWVLRSGQLRRCEADRGLKNRYCHHHIDQCRGMKLDGAKCRAKMKQPGYLYCCVDHDPAERATRLNPRDFQLDYLRDNRMDDIVALYKYRDPYHKVKLPVTLGLNYQLDHIFELQCAAHAVRNVAFRDPEDRQLAVQVLRDEVLNENENLCFTLTTTNQIKGAAVRKFLDDTRTGHVGIRTFTEYMMDEEHKITRTRVDRKVTKQIRSEMMKANKACQNKLNDESEAPEFERLLAQFQQLYVAMKH